MALRLPDEFFKNPFSSANPGPLGVVATYQLARVGISLPGVRVANDIFSCLFGIKRKREKLRNLYVK